MKVNVLLILVFFYMNITTIFCSEDGCQVGYYNLNGICNKCSDVSTGCSECIYKIQEDKKNGNIICNKCISDEYHLSTNGVCEKCQYQNCEKCHYINIGIKECIKCNKGYYKNSKGECAKCNNIKIKGGECEICSDNQDAENTICFCNNNFAYDGSTSCIECPDGCNKCKYNKESKKVECLNCFSNYVLNSYKNCTYCGEKCEHMDDNQLFHNRKSEVYYASSNNENNCSVDFCKTCVKDNPNKCSICNNTNYEVNKYTGSCVMKTEYEPVIFWKDVYNLDMNDGKESNGISFKLRGITTSQINLRHAFLVILKFKLKHLLRNLQEMTDIEAICEMKRNWEESNNTINIVDYDCITNRTVNETYYKLVGIEGDNYINIINDPFKNESIYEDKDKPLLLNLQNYDDFNKQNFNTTTIDFFLNGDLSEINPSKPINNQTNIEMELNEIEDIALCSFEFYLDNSYANLYCNLEITSNISTTDLTFKNKEIDLDIENNLTLYINSLNKLKLSYIKNETNGTNGTEDTGGESVIIYEESHSHKTLIIVGVVVGVVFICGIVVIMVFAFKSGSNRKITDYDINEISKDNSNNYITNNNILNYN